MATVTKGREFVSGETVTPVKLNTLVDNATITFSTAADADDSTLEVSGNKFRVKDNGITAAKVTPLFPVQIATAHSAARGSTILFMPTASTPASTQGAAWISASITPKSASNAILVRFTGQITTNGFSAVVAIFRGSTCVAAQAFTPGGSLYLGNVCVEAYDQPNTTSEITYQVRIGNDNGPNNTTIINGDSSSALFGGACNSVLTLTEIKA